MWSFDYNVCFVNAYFIVKILISLAIDHGNFIVAFGKAYNMEDACQVLHTISLGSDCVRLSIHDPLDDSAPLSISHSEMITVSDVVGAFIVWPKNLSLWIHGYIVKIKSQS